MVAKLLFCVVFLETLIKTKELYILPWIEIKKKPGV